VLRAVVRYESKVNSLPDVPSVGWGTKEQGEGDRETDDELSSLSSSLQSDLAAAHDLIFTISASCSVILQSVRHHHISNIFDVFPCETLCLVCALGWTQICFELSVITD
jgi:hypothetical protein